MRPCTRRIVPAKGIIKATSLNEALGEHAPWCRTAPAALSIRIKPLEGGAVYGSLQQELVEELDELREARLYKGELVLESPQSAHVEVEGMGGLLNLCANNLPHQQEK